MNTFNFEEWAALHEADPEAFEIRREAALSEVVNKADPTSKLLLEQTLFRANMVRRRAKSPLQSAMESSNLMWESFGKLREKLNELEEMAKPANLGPGGLRLVGAADNKPENIELSEVSVSLTPLDDASAPIAKIISFPRKTND